MRSAGQDVPWVSEHREALGRRGRRRAHSVIDHQGGFPDALACALTARPESVKLARDFARTTLYSWGMPDLFDDLGLVVSELVTNALRHALSVDGLDRPSDELTHLSPIRVTLRRNGSHVVCAVTDPSDDIPIRKKPDHVAESGRGLHLVESFSRAWGWTPMTGRGKVVWALFHRPG